MQEEPGQHALPHMALHLTPELDGIPFLRISRPQLAAPSVGQHSVHVEEQQALLAQAFS